MSEVVIFNPEGIAIGEYRSKYPELKNIREFDNLSDFELVLIWYYSNPTSYYVYEYPAKKDRMKHVCEKMFDSLEGEEFQKKFFEKTLHNQEEIDIAVERMSRVIPDVRREAKEMIDTIFDDYKTLLEMPLENFKKPGGETDFANYLSVRKQIIKDMDDIIEKVERGYGINKVGDLSADGQALIEDYHKNRQR